MQPANSVSCQNSYLLILFFFIALTLTGCAGIAVEGGLAAKSKLVISQNIDAAEAGDASAQYEVGKAYCCSVSGKDPIYNTEIAVDWLCRSARQGYTPAMLKLGNIYSGDTIDGARIQRRIAKKLSGVDTNFAVALVWYRFARKYGGEKASDRISEIQDSLDPNDINTADSIYQKGILKADCEWNQSIQ